MVVVDSVRTEVDQIKYCRECRHVRAPNGGTYRRDEKNPACARAPDPVTGHPLSCAFERSEGSCTQAGLNWEAALAVPTIVKLAK